jgi:hypothetical protein
VNDSSPVEKRFGSSVNDYDLSMISTCTIRATYILQSSSTISFHMCFFE